MEEDRAANQRPAFSLSFTLALYISNAFGLRKIPRNISLYQSLRASEWWNNFIFVWNLNSSTGFNKRGYTSFIMTRVILDPNLWNGVLIMINHLICFKYTLFSIYGRYQIIKQKLSERDKSRDSICMQTQL